MQKIIQATSPDEYIVVGEENDGAGATTYWTLSSGVDLNKLEAALEKVGIDNRPRYIESETALHRAVTLLGGKRRIIRPVRKGKWAVMEEELDASKDRLKHWDGPTIEIEAGLPKFENTTQEEEALVKAAYMAAFGALDTSDLSAWLLSGISQLGAVGLRKTGGIYYIPPTGMPTWRKYIQVLADVDSGCVVYTMPTVKMTADGAKAILDGLTTEIEEAAAKLTTRVVSGDLGLRGLENRAAASSALLRKVQQYEHVVGARLDRLRGVIAQLDVDVAAAKLAAEAVADDDAVLS